MDVKKFTVKSSDGLLEELFDMESEFFSNILWVLGNSLINTFWSDAFVLIYLLFILLNPALLILLCTLIGFIKNFLYKVYIAKIHTTRGGSHKNVGCRGATLYLGLFVTIEGFFEVIALNFISLKLIVSVHLFGSEHILSFSL